MNKYVKIGNKRIGPRKSTFIIAEAGVNHNGKLSLAKQLVDAAVEAGADAVKFQTYKSERVVAKDTTVAEYQEENTEWEDQLEMIKSFELPLEAFETLHQYCEKKGTMFLSTPHSNGEIIEFLDEIVPAFKVASPDLTNPPFLRKIARKGKPIILSTGMGTMQEVREALKVIKEEGNEQLILLHCTSNYPCPLEEVNLRVIQTMQKELEYPIGYSDHTLGKTVPIMATALGAVVLEKHFTIDKDLPGPDHEIGSMLVRCLLRKGYTVKVMDNLLYGDHGIDELFEEENFTFFKGDATHIADIVEGMKDVDAVVHLAAIVGEPATELKPQTTLEVNRFSTRTLGHIAKELGISRFIFASTCSVYGFQEKKCSETSQPNPISLYADTKLTSEHILEDLDSRGFHPVILRFATAYGLSPRMRFDLVVNLLIAKAIEDKEITVFGEGKQYRPFVHIKDISRAIIKTLEAPRQKIAGEIFNVGSNSQNLQIKELAEIIKKKVPEADLKFIKEKEDERSYRVSFTKINEQLGFNPKYTIEDTVEEIKNSLKKDKLEKPYTNQKYSNYKSLNEK